MSACWSAARIDQLARTSAEGGDREHLDECEDCRTALEHARRDLSLIAELRASARADDQGFPAGYRKIAELRRGGQGIVYRAEQLATRREVALKVLPPGAGARERRRLEREVELLSRLDHPHLVTLFDSGLAGGAPWYAMELVDGRPLDEWARETKPGSAAIVAVFRRIAAAVAHAHQRGVIHRDLKPANVVIDARGEPRVLDFGTALAAAVEPERLRVTAPGEFLGTLAYAAPEQLRGATQQVDTRTDVYALCAAMYETLTGKLPHDRSGDLAQLIERVTTTAPVPPSVHARGIDRDLDAVVAKGLATDPRERYGSAEALERDLARYERGEPLEARAHGAFYVLRRYVARRRKALAIAAVVAVSALGLAVAWLREFERAEQQREQAALVRSVVQDLLGAAAPQRMGGDVRLLDVYERVARDLDQALARAPDVQAEVELTIGDTYRRLLRPNEAEPHLRKALARFREIDDRRELQVARAGNLLALTLADQNDPEAIDAARAALAIRSRELADGDALVAESRRTVAIALIEQFRDGDTTQARELLGRALDAYVAAFGEDHAEVAETKLWLARVTDPDDLGTCESLLSSALATFERAQSDDPRTIAAANGYASFLQQLGRFDEAHAVLDRSADLTHKLFGDALATDMLRRYARLEFARGNAQAADLLSRQSVARELERWADQRPAERDALRALARRIEQPGAPSAPPPLADAFAALRRIQGDGTFELAQWMNGIALNLRVLGRAAEIEPLLREALHIRCRAMGPDCPVRRHTIELLAAQLIDENRGGEMVALLEESVATFERVGETSSNSARHASQLLAICRQQARESAPGEGR